MTEVTIVLFRIAVGMNIVNNDRLFAEFSGQGMVVNG